MRGLTMNFIRRFLYGRYGGDQLSVALLILFLVLSVSGSLAHMPVLQFASYIPLVICYFRMLSRNTQKRYSENARFLSWFGRIKQWFVQKQAYLKSLRTHRYYKCPQCTKKLRVPRGKGRICIKCPVCKTEFIKKT